MATTDVHKEIKNGISNAASNPQEYGFINGTKIPIPRRTLEAHPNKNLRLTEQKTFTLNRKTMDPSQGIDGFVTMTVKADTAAEARLIMDDMVTRINEPFITHEHAPRGRG